MNDNAPRTLDRLTVGGRAFDVRRAVADDVGSVVALLGDDLLGSSRETAPPKAYRRAFDEVDRDPGQLLAVVTDETGAAVGTMQLSLIPGLSRGGTKRLLIEAVRVAASARGTGLGAAIFEWAERYGHDHGATLVQLTTDTSRTDAHRFYERLGYAASHVGFKKALGAASAVVTRSEAPIVDDHTDDAESAEALVALPLRTDRLSLRTHRAEDVDRLHQIYSRDDVARYLLDEPWTADKAQEQLAKRLQRTELDGPSGALALVIDLNRTCIGDVALWFTDKERRVAEIGWVLDPDFGGKGYAAEAVRAVLDLALGQLRLHRVVAQMDARNDVSAKLATAVGMRHEAHHRQDWWSKGKWTDTVVFAALAGDRKRVADDD